MTLAAVLKRMKVTSVTAHGFRSSFRDWAGSVVAGSDPQAEWDETARKMTPALAALEAPS